MISLVVSSNLVLLWVISIIITLGCSNSGNINHYDNDINFTEKWKEEIKITVLDYLVFPTAFVYLLLSLVLSWIFKSKTEYCTFWSGRYLFLRLLISFHLIKAWILLWQCLFIFLILNFFYFLRKRGKQTTKSRTISMAKTGR